MDWRDLLDERRRRQSQDISGFTFAQPNFAAATTPPEDNGGFFGSIGHAVAAPFEGAANVVKGVGGFFGNMVKDVVETGATAVGGIKDVIEGSVAANQDLKNSEERLKITKDTNRQLQQALGAAYDDPNSSRWNDPDVKRIIEQGNQKVKDFDTAHAEQTANNRKQYEEAQKVDPLKTAAASGETALNIASLGIGGIAKGAVKQGAKMVGKEILTDVAENTAKNVVKTAAARTAGGAAKRLAAGAGEGALFGAGYGFIDPYAKEGQDANLSDAWQGALTGAAFGGAIGGAIPLLDKNVRAGVREMPAAVRQGASQAVDVAKQYTPTAMAERSPAVLAIDDHLALLNGERDRLVASGLSENSPAVRQNAAAYTAALQERARTIRMAKEGGYIKNPFYREGGDAAGNIGDANDAADLARRQLNGEDITAQQPVDPMISDYIQSEASQYSSPEQYRQKLIDDLWAENKQGKGVETGFTYGDPNSYDVTGRWAVSNNSPFYQAYYREYGRGPTKKGITDMVDQELMGKEGEYHPLLTSDENGPIPFARDIYQQLADREAGLQQSLREGPPADMYGQFATDLGQPGAPAAPTAAPRPVSAAPAEKVGQGFYDDPSALQRALARGESQTNNAVDFVDTSGAPRPQQRVGVQQNLDTSTPNPYEGMSQNLEAKALPQGELPKPATPAQAKRQFKKDGKMVEFLNQRQGSSKPIELPASVEEGRNIATRQTPGGKVKPLAKNNAHITTDDVAAIRAIAEDGTSNAFTMTKTPEMNLAEAFKNRGGENSKEFRVLDKFNTSIREHTAEYTDWLQEKRGFLEKFINEYGIDGAAARDMRPYLEAKTKEAGDEYLKQYAATYGKQKAEGLVKFRDWWRSTKDQVRSETNDVIKKYAGEDRMMGDLGPSYVPRVYKSGTPGFKEAFLDVAHGKMDGIGGENGLFNLKNGTGYLSKEAETTGGGVLRNAEGIPLNSEFAKPNTTYLSAAQKRTAKSPIKEMEDPLTSIMRYFEATGRAKYFTEDIARGQTLRDAIQLVNNETGNLRQMYKSFEDQVNALAGKTARIDRPFVDSEGGAKFVNVASKLQSRVARSTILGSANSALAQTGQLPLIAAENGGKNFAGGMSDLMRFVRSKGANDPMAGSAFMRTRYPKYEDIFKVSKAGRAANKGTDVIAKPFRLIEHAATELAWRSSYRRALETGLSGKAAIQEADRIAAKIVGERSPGARAALYESKALSPVTSYTLEVNQLYQVAKQYFKRDPKRAAKLVGAIWLYNQGYSAITGNKLNADPIAATLDAGKILTDQNYVDKDGNPIGMGERLVRAGGRLAGEAIDATPLGGPVAGSLYPEYGFRIPFGGGARTLSRTDVFGDTNFGRYGGGTPLASGLSNPLLLLGIPGMNQLQRSVEGANAVSQGASVSPSGDTRFLIENTPEEYWRAILFGQYGTQAGRDYLNQQNASLAGYAQ